MSILMAPWAVQGAFVFNKTISADVSNYNLRADAIAAGWDGVMPLAATVTINSGVVVSANATSQYGFDTGATIPNGSTLALSNNGYIIGMGGAGGHYTSPWTGKDGGPALRAQCQITITNNGTIGGGGGGGGGASNDAGGGGGRTGRTNSVGGNGYYGGTSIGQPGTFAAPGGSGSGYGSGAGGGGDWGAAGKNAPGGGAGGAGGAAVVGNSFINWAATGTRFGAVT